MREGMAGGQGEARRGVKIGIVENLGWCCVILACL